MPVAVVVEVVKPDEQIDNPDDFDNCSDARYRRYDESPSARYCSRDPPKVVLLTAQEQGSETMSPVGLSVA